MSRKDALAMIERAMVRVRRSQTRQTLGRLMERATGRRLNISHSFVVDALEEGLDDDGREPTVGTVAERLGIDPSRASRMVASAVKAGYVRRVASQEDGRRILLRLTGKGRQCAAKARGFRTAFFARVVEDWADRDCAEFARLLSKFTEPQSAPPYAQSSEPRQTPIASRDPVALAPPKRDSPRLGGVKSGQKGSPYLP